MRRIGTLNGRAVVQGDPNIVKPNEILLQNKEEKTSLLKQAIRSRGLKIDTSKIEIN